MHTIKPIDEAAVLSAARTGRVIAAQDHNIIGGLGYYAAAVIAQAGISSQYKILGCPDRFVPIATAPYLFHVNEYDADGLYKNMKKMLDK
jgi:transketolase